MASNFEKARTRPAPNERTEIAEGIDEYNTERGVPDDAERKRLRIHAEILEEQAKRAEEFKRAEEEIEARKRYRDALRFEMDPKSIRKIAQTPDERRICTEVYKEIVAERLEGIGAIRVYLLNALAQNPDAEFGSLAGSVMAIAERHNLRQDTIYGPFYSFFQQYRLRRDAMSRKSDNEIRADAEYLKRAIEEIYRDTFSIFFIGPKIADIGLPNRSGGGAYWPYLEGGIYSTSSDRPGSADSKRTRIHEEQHAIYSLEHHQEINARESEGLDSALVSARNEMLAYLRESKGIFSGASFLLPRYKTYSDEPPNPYRYMHENLSDKDKGKYESYLKAGAIAAGRLLESSGLGVEEIIGILSQTPLKKWGTTADRIIDAKASVRKYDKLADRLKQFGGIVRKLWSHE